jgi:hypothetical protein
MLCGSTKLHENYSSASYAPDVEFWIPESFRLSMKLDDSLWPLPVPSSIAFVAGRVVRISGFSNFMMFSLKARVDVAFVLTDTTLVTASSDKSFEQTSDDVCPM